MTDYEYLKSHRYDWSKDERKLRKWNEINKYMEIPSGRCFCCARLFEGSKGEYQKKGKDKDSKEEVITIYTINYAFCNQCEMAMSISRWNPYEGNFEHNPNRDYEYFHNANDKLESRARRNPIDFDTEDFANNLPVEEPIAGNFKLANGVDVV